MSTIETMMPKGGILNAYGIASRLKGGAALPQEVQSADKSAFSNMIKEASQKAVETVRNADEAMKAGMRDEISVQEVIQATMAAEATIKTVVNIRDKMVTAYQEVIRMPI